MWQLKTIQDENKNVETIDTIYYSFQRQAIFSCTLLHEKENEAATATVIYGYIDFPDNNHLHIQLDKNQKGEKYLLPWNWGEETPVSELIHDIVKLDSKNMVLSHNGKTYNFIKY
jgi:hypothetical protein